MAYHFKHGDKTVEEGLRRIALDQIDKAIAEVDDRRLGASEKIHQLRKRCKKLRGLIRLVRPFFDDYRLENAAFRDAARSLAFVRDAAVMINTYDSLMDAYRDQVERAAFASVRRRLTLRQQDAMGRRADIQHRLAQFRIAMLHARKRARQWRLSRDAFDALAGGLSKNYKRAEKAVAQARKHPVPAAFHEWRKRIKYHSYHARLLAPVWPEAMKSHFKAADRLNDVLGEHHDLAVFRKTLADDPDAFGRAKNIEVMLGLVRRRQAVLEAEAFALGTRLLAEPDDALLLRWRAYWDIWRAETRPSKQAMAA